MKTLLLCCVCVAMSLAAQEPARKGKTKARSAQPAAAAGAAKTAVPAGAVEFEPGSFRYTDAQGNRWIYRRTPFGVARFAAAPAPAAPAAAAQPAAPLSEAAQKSLDAVKATDQGDSVRFERVTPFGVNTWQTKKSDLDEMEQAVWNRQRERDAR